MPAPAPLPLEQTKVFIDTCSLMHEDARTVLTGELADRLARANAKLYVLTHVVAELKKHAEDQSPGAEERRAAARRGLTVLHELAQRNLVALLSGGENDPFTDQLFQTVFTYHMTRYPLTLITQDVSLQEDILRLAERKSVHRIKPIAAWEIRRGRLEPVTLEEAERRLRRRTQQQQGSRAEAAQAAAASWPRPRVRYQLTRQLVPLDNTRRAVSVQPLAPGAVLFTEEQRPVTLTRQLGEGGEGEVYETDNPGRVAKLYFPNQLTPFRYEKLKLMVSKGLDWSHPDAAGITWPRHLLFDQTGQFRGYLMDRARGKTLNAILIKQELDRNFPTWNRLHLVQLCCAILRKLRFLHESNILMGDINPRNFLIVDERTVSLVDCDSYQVEGFPCPVGDVQFTPPELQGQPFSQVLRTPDQEYFAMASLLFMILHIGKPPYAQVGGGSPQENIRTMNFPYAVGERRGRNVPPGPYADIFSNLPRKVKDAFLETFDREHRGKPRKNAAEWLELMESYEYAVKQGWVTADLIPKGRKQLTKADYDRLGIPARAFICEKCGQDFAVPEKALQKRAAEGKPLPTWCDACRREYRRAAQPVRAPSGGPGTLHPAPGQTWRPPVGQRQAPVGQRQATARPGQATSGPRQMTAGPQQTTSGPRQATAGRRQLTAGPRQPAPGSPSAPSSTPGVPRPNPGTARRSPAPPPAQPQRQEEGIGSLLTNLLKQLFGI